MDETTNPITNDTQPTSDSNPIETTLIEETTILTTQDNSSDNNGDIIPSIPVEIPNYIDVYTYDKDGYYIGTSTAERSPMDKNVVYLRPPNSIEEKPPEVENSKIQKWNGMGWDIVDNPNPSNKSPEEIISDLQTKFTELETKVDKLEKLMTGVIVSKLNVIKPATITS